MVTDGRTQVFTKGITESLDELALAVTIEENTLCSGHRVSDPQMRWITRSRDIAEPPGGGPPD